MNGDRRRGVAVELAIDLGINLVPRTMTGWVGPPAPTLATGVVRLRARCWSPATGPAKPLSMSIDNDGRVRFSILPGSVEKYSHPVERPAS
jgi:hypothetical protein